MKRILLLFAAGCTLVNAMAQSTCATAVPIGNGLHICAGIMGPQPPTPICAGGSTVASMGEWYRYMATMDTALVVTTSLVQNTGGDTRFHVYTGECGSLVCVAGDDDSGAGFLSIATFNITAGTNYYIAFDNRWNANGFTFEVAYQQPSPPPPPPVISFTPVSISSQGSGKCVVDMNGDFLDDVVATGSTWIHINHQQPGGGFVPTLIPTTQADHVASWSIAAGDIDANGYNDLVYGGGQGVTFMMANETGTAFTEVSFSQYVFSQRTNMIDINNDGHLDVFVCHDVAPNVFFMNDGFGNLSFNQGGLGPNGGNYGSLWTDYDNDGDQDMFVAKCGSSPPDVFMHNNGDGTFTDVANMYGLADGHQSWSSAWGDFDNDGDMDVLIGTSSSGFHKLLRNDLGSFANVTPGSGFDTFSGQGIEWITYDFNNDGWLDVMGGGAILFNNGDMTFTTQFGGPSNGAVGDLNNDGFLDIVNGTTIHMNNGNENNWLKVHTVGTVSNKNGIGARIVVTTPHGSQIREVRSGEGFAFMNTLTAHFGLGDETEIISVTIHWPSGIVNIIDGPAINGTLVVVEQEVITSMADSPASDLQVFPNPTQDMLQLSGPGIDAQNVASIHNTAGQLVWTGSLTNHRIDVRNLARGTYILQVNTANGPLKRNFTKQ
jgi:hypothetical protein